MTIDHSNPFPFSEINSVRLMGTIEHEVHTFRGGSIKLYLKTLNKDAS